MKKTFLLILLIIIIYEFISNSIYKSNLIPDEAIRLRVIANSNSDYDQNMKIKVRNVLQREVFNLLKDTKGIDEARNIITNNLDNIDNSIYNILQNNDYNMNYKVNFGFNYFPAKKYKGIIYDEGMYESLYVTLGKGEGDNWWCVLFPPLCLIEAEESDEIEYKSFVQELIEKYL